MVEVFRRQLIMVIPLLSFAAEDVGAETVEFTPDSVVHMIAFGVGDPEAGGHGWNFSRSFDDDLGVCTVREIQRATIYEGIASFTLHRSGLECVFDSDGSAKVGVAELHIGFEIDDRVWEEVSTASRFIFRDRPYFKWVGRDR
jgi:hypothetical protein